MKQICLLFLTVLSVQYSFSQNTATSHSLFTTMPNFLVDKYSVKQSDFDQLDIYSPSKKSSSGYEVIKKEGALESMTFKWQGEWQKGPSPLQILNNFKTAVKQKGGAEVFYDDFYKDKVFFKLKQGGDTYWIKVITDGIGNYTVSSIKEVPMNQDIVMTVDDIKKNLADEGRVSFYGIYFDTDKSVIKPESTPTLTNIAVFLKANPVNVYIVGHTDNTGNFDRNLALSKERAAAVVNELTTKYGVNKAQVAAQGVASLAPVASNKSDEGKAKNRRVEIVVK